jgi:hypothetical protein
VTLDPVLGVALRVGLALLFLDASIHKLRDFNAFRGAVSGYRIVPGWGEPIAAGALVAAELAVAAALLVPGLGPAPGLASVALLLMYASAIGVNLARGRRDIDCGCAGRAAQGSLHGGLVVRNLVLAGLALVVSFPGGSRSLHWVDGVTLVGLVVSGAVLYAAADRAMANAPQLAALRVRS